MLTVQGIPPQINQPLHHTVNMSDSDQTAYDILSAIPGFWNGSLAAMTRPNSTDIYIFRVNIDRDRDEAERRDMEGRAQQAAQQAAAAAGQVNVGNDDPASNASTDPSDDEELERAGMGSFDDLTRFSDRDQMILNERLGVVKDTLAAASQQEEMSDGQLTR